MSSISSDVDTGLQSMTLRVGPGLGVNWTLSLTVNGVSVNRTTPEQQEALLFSFRPPVLRSMSRTSGSTQGMYNVTLVGENFGTAAFFASAGRCVCACK